MTLIARVDRANPIAIRLGRGTSRPRQRPVRLDPHRRDRPRTNGKLERFHQTMAREWAYGLVYRSHHERAAALPHWLDHYNRCRPHSPLGGRPPISRVQRM
jgi:transposase InsO family protein